MKNVFKFLACLLAVIGTGCTNLSRSRDLGNPDIPPAVTAQQVCGICHGIDGNSRSPNFPKLAGQQEEYFKIQMDGFRAHRRSDPAGFEYMWGLARKLSDKQIQGLAAYFSKQKNVPDGAPGVDLSAGKRIFETGVPEKKIPACKTCHGPSAEGAGQFPRLAGQHADYLVKQLSVFQRTNERPEGSIMKTVAHDLTRANMVSVAAYLSTL